MKSSKNKINYLLCFHLHWSLHRLPLPMSVTYYQFWWVIILWDRQMEGVSSAVKLSLAARMTWAWAVVLRVQPGPSHGPCAVMCSCVMCADRPWFPRVQGWEGTSDPCPLSSQKIWGKGRLASSWQRVSHWQAVLWSKFDSRFMRKVSNVLSEVCLCF